MLRKLKERLRNFWEDLIYPISLDEFLVEEIRRQKINKIARDCAVLEEKIKAAKRKKKKSSHIEREFVLKKSELLKSEMLRDADISKITGISDVMRGE